VRNLKLISEVARDLGIPRDALRPYGIYKAKIALSAVTEGAKRKRAKLVLVTAMTPTPAGEGKTVTAIGLSSALSRLGHRTVVCVRQPSLGPLFGVKGGAAGGGRSTVEPMQEINMRFTGDIDAVAASHNLLSAMLDNHLFHGNELHIDPQTISWNRTLDMDDRALRHVTVRPSGAKDSPGRDESFVITAASEVMTILSLSRNYVDLKERLGRIIVGFNEARQPIRAGDLTAQGAMAAILKEALEPNLAQTIDGTPALIHGGPFGNIATGTSSLISILLALSYADYCVVEAGFGSDLGAEKFFDIVARLGGFLVDAAVIVASIKALKYHSQQQQDPVINKVTREANLAGSEILASSTTSLSAGLENLEKHIENIRSFGILPVVALNRFSSDVDKEVELVRHSCEKIGVPFAVSEVFDHGASGGIELAKHVLAASQQPHANRPVYELEDTIDGKIKKIVRTIYGGKDAELSERALKDIQTIKDLGLERLPVCMAKTALSLSDDPKKLGRPSSFSVKVTHIGIAAGAGFVIPYMGDIMTMPGLPKHPAAERMDISDSGDISGVF
jgi:formate--tetrahydrofolate ligase